MWRIHLWDHYRNRKIRLILLSCLCNPYSTTQGVYQWSTTMSNCLFTIFTLQLPWGSAPRGQHQPKSIRTTPCDITYIIHIHKSLHTNSPPPPRCSSLHRALNTEKHFGYAYNWMARKKNTQVTKHLVSISNAWQNLRHVERFGAHGWSFYRCPRRLWLVHLCFICPPHTGLKFGRDPCSNHHSTNTIIRISWDVG